MFGDSKNYRIYFGVVGKVVLEVACCLPVFSTNYGLVLIITSETELEISGACCAKILIEKGV